MIANIVTGVIILAAVAGAVAYIVRAKKRGVKCIGCSNAGCCSAQKEQEHSDCGCGGCSCK